MAATGANNPVYVHGTAAALAFLTSLPIPNAPADKLKEVAWLSYGLVNEKVKDSGILESIKPKDVNYIGAATFAVYILVALYLSLRVFSRLAHAASDITESQTSQRLSIFSSMAFLGFTIQAVNMGLFLVDSFLSWQKNPVVRVKLLASRGLRFELWEWVTTSTFFVDFAESLYQTSGGYWWASQGLSATMMSTMFMSAAGGYYQIDNLLDYIVLAQIMPVAFIQNLFFVAVLLQRFRKPANARKAEKPSGLLPEPVAWISFAIFRGLIAYLPLLVSNYNQAVPAIAATRILILMNYLVSFSADSVLEEALPWTMLYKIGFSLSSAALSTSTMAAWVFSIGVNFAVNALGVDFLIWYASILMWWLAEYLS